MASVEFSRKLSEKAVQKVVARLTPILLPGEDILYVGQCINFMPALSHFLITDTRIIGAEQGSVRFAYHGSELESYDVDPIKGRVTLKASGAEPFTVKSIPQPDIGDVRTHLEHLKARTTASGEEPQPVPTLAPPTGIPRIATDDAAPLPPRSSGDAAAPGQPVRYCGGELRNAAARAVAELSRGDETPWLILNPGGATGALVAFEDRLAIIKTGALTGFMAGSTFGGRQTVIYFNDITGIEFNAGLMTGVLEVLTASYQGTANKDFWQGTLSSRNANSNDPFTLSNTLPMTKSEYRDCQEHINELRHRISIYKRPVAHTPAAIQPAQDSFADQLAKLAQLRADGLLSDEEFAAAKQKLMRD